MVAVCRIRFRVLGYALIMAGLVVGSAGLASAEDVHIFFAGGQSNAVPTRWGAGVEAGLADSGKFGDFRFISQQHSGDGMWSWVGWTPDGEGGKDFIRNVGQWTATENNYAADFFNDEGTGALQQVVNEVKANGDTPVVGLFWFQGEGDTANQTGVEYWSEAFPAMLNFIREDLGQSDPITVGLTIIDYNHDDTGLSDEQMAAVDALRIVQADMGTTDENIVAWDSAQYTRLDAWHLIAADSTQCGYDLATAYAAEIPEPASLVLLVAGGLGLARRRRRRSA